MIAPFFSDYMHIVFGLLFLTRRPRKKRKKYLCTVFENSIKRSHFKTLRAKRATFTFEWSNQNAKNDQFGKSLKMRHFW